MDSIRIEGEVNEVMGHKKATAKDADQFQMTVKVTPAGIRAAYDRLAAARRRLRTQAQRDLVALTEELGRMSAYRSEEEALVEIEAARDEVYQQRQQER